MDMETIKTFIKVMELKNFSKAAEELKYTQANISIRIKKLERYLDTKLFNRNGTIITPTKKAYIFLPYAQKIIQTLDYSKKCLLEDKILDDITIRVSSSNTPGGYILPKIILDFNKEHPNLKIINDIKYRSLVLFDVEQNICDIGFVSQPKTVETASLKYTKIATDPLCIVVSSTHPLASKRFIDEKDLAKEKIFLSNPKSSIISMLENKLGIHIDKNNIIIMGNLEAVKQTAINNFGIAILSSSVVKAEIEQKKLVKIRLKTNINFIRYIYCIKKETKELNYATTIFLNYVKNHIDN